MSDALLLSVALVLHPNSGEWWRGELLLLLLSLLVLQGRRGRAGGEGSNPSKVIPVGKPIVPPYNGSKALPFARVFHENKTAGASPDVEEAGKSSDSLLEEIRASPPPFEYYHGEQLEDDPQLTAGNMKKFRAVVREFTKFSLVSTIVEYFFFL